MIIILLGAPGVGKGTQAKILQEKLRLVHISSGDLLRDHRKRGTDLGRIADEYMVKGELVPDKLVIDMIIERISEPDVEHGVLLDGFPRTGPQAGALDEALSIRNKRVNKAIYVKAAEDVLLDRLSGRWTCTKCGHIYHDKFAPPRVPGICDLDGSELFQRNDDKRETAVKRLQVYFEQTMPIIQHYRDKHILCEINGDQPIEKVTEDVMEYCLR
jgi:adenylate kinase